MPDVTQRPMNVNTFILVAGFFLTIVTLVVSGAGTFFTLRGDVSTIQHDTAKLGEAVDQIQQLIIARSADRYSKQDAERDNAIVRGRFDAVERRLEAVESRGIERDKQLDQLNHSLSDILGAVRAVRPPR